LHAGAILLLTACSLVTHHVRVLPTTSSHLACWQLCWHFERFSKLSLVLGSVFRYGYTEHSASTECPLAPYHPWSPPFPTNTHPRQQHYSSLFRGSLPRIFVCCCCRWWWWWRTTTHPGCGARISLLLIDIMGEAMSCDLFNQCCTHQARPGR
jgi:hypothetical protein